MISPTASVLIVCVVIGVFFSLALFSIDYSHTESKVKVLEVGKRYLLLNWGEQYYARIANAYSDKFTTSTETWTTCVTPDFLEAMREAQKKDEVVTITVDGYPFVWIWDCLSGDRITSVK